MSSRSYRSRRRARQLRTSHEPRLSYRQNSYRAVPAAGTVKRGRGRTAASAATKSRTPRVRRPWSRAERTPLVGAVSAPTFGRSVLHRISEPLRELQRVSDAIRCKERPNPNMRRRSGAGTKSKAFVPWCSRRA